VIEATRGTALLLGSLAALAFSRAALAQRRVETLVMPGPVVQSHADIESECGKCHSRLSDTPQNRLCVSCHQDVGSDVADGRGFHGRVPAAETVECRACHIEHAGRGAEIVRLDSELFDHDTTDYPLHGAHERVACERCHADGAKHREAPSVCYDCHAADDPHAGRLGQSCEGCHSDKAWREVRFDHDQTDFPLTGKHGNVGCAACHVNERYRDLPSECSSCHLLDDVHRGTRGPSCEKCHASSDWKQTSFDHGRDTDFPLEGGHSGIACISCHRGNPYAVKVRSTCVACHRADDDHLGRFGGKCETCHSAERWRDVAFDHQKATGFALAGQHTGLDCEACHSGPIYEVALATSCESCHAADDPHAGQQGKACGSCHEETGWTRNVPFDHDITRFPLLGLHAAVPCEECHLTPEYRNASSVCVDCHAEQDVHAATLGARCEQCHTPASWPLWKFDHDAQTHFPLLGAHDGLACAACHRTPVASRIELSTTCGSCHEREDVHRGRFGRNCDRCHTAASFADVHVRP
jgi:hypothetical protein